MNTNQPSISVIIPTLNEKGNIVPICRAVLMGLKEKNPEIIVIDDHSDDGTAEEVEKFMKRESRVRLHVRKNERCLTTAIVKGFELSRAPLIARIDSDFILRARELLGLVEAVEKGSDLSFASRYVAQGQDYRKEWGRIFLSYLINIFCQFVISSKFKDYTSCLFVCRREVMEQVPLRGDYGEFFLPFIHEADLAGFKIKELPYVCRSRRKGVSKTSPSISSLIRRGRKYIKMAIETKKSA